MSSDVTCFTFYALFWLVEVEYPRETSSGGCTSITDKEVLLLRSEILSYDGSRASDAPPSIEMSSSLTASCLIPDVMDGSSDGDILKHGGGTVFVRDFNFLPIWRDLLAMVAVSSSLPCERA